MFLYNAVCGRRDRSKRFCTLLPWWTCSMKHRFNKASSHVLQLMRDGCSYTYPPKTRARYSFIQLGELEQYRVKILAQCFNTTAQDSNPGYLGRESEALPLGRCVFIGKMFLVAVDATPKWIETHIMNSTTSTATACKLG